MPDFASLLIDWQKRHGRHDLPWQNIRDPYRIWVSEIMLQQTQVAAVIPYYLRFIKRFPDIESLAQASLDEVLAHWSGLGYYSRARNLHRAAQLIAADYGGKFPCDKDQIEKLPGIGRSTAAAIAVFAYGGKHAILDGNVKRVFTRCYGIKGYPGEKKIGNALWQKAGRLLPQRNIKIYTQALMDLGATVCTRANPKCPICPLHKRCAAYRGGFTAQLPTTKPRKILPQKQTALLMLLRKGEILLEKRPPSGVWGGLWCLPEMATHEDPVAYSAMRFGARVSSLEPLPVLDHGFTHFKLRIYPKAFRVDALSPMANERGWVWINIEDALGAAIPAPVRKLLNTLVHRG